MQKMVNEAVATAKGDIYKMDPVKLIAADGSAVALIRGGMVWHADNYSDPATWRPVGGAGGQLSWTDRAGSQLTSRPVHRPKRW